MTLYRSPKGLFQFQAHGIAQLITTKSLLCTWETGCGKSHLCLAGGSLLVDDQMVDLVMVVCEQNKVVEFVRDFETFTDLRVVKYTGTVKRRENIRMALSGHEESIESLGLDGPPQVLVTTYETSRNDIGRFSKQKINGKTKKVWEDRPLMTTLEGVVDLGIAIFYDESTRLGGRFVAGHARSGGRWQPQRGSVTYKAHEHLLKRLRSLTPNVWVAGLTATPIETSPENAYNQVRLISPQIAPSIKSWEENYVRHTDQFGRSTFKNISGLSVHQEPWVTPFSDLIEPIVSHKKKTDPDVRKNFPDAVEEPMFVELSKEHMDLYHAVASLEADEDLYPDGMTKSQRQVLFGLLRQVASHPMSISMSPAASKEGTLANLILERVGVDALKAMRAAKEDDLVSKLNSLVRGQGSQAVIFTFYGQSTLHLLHKRLVDEGFSVVIYHGGMSASQKSEAQHSFRSGSHQILLSSDAGARGLNLPEAQYVFNYELCLTHAKTTQRVNRISRIDSGHPSVTSFSMVALDTVEERVLDLNIQRQSWHEELFSDEEESVDGESEDFLGLLSADQRDALFKIRRGRVSRSA